MDHKQSRVCEDKGLHAVSHPFRSDREGGKSRHDQQQMRKKEITYSKIDHQWVPFDFSQALVERNHLDGPFGGSSLEQDLAERERRWIRNNERADRLEDGDELIKRRQRGSEEEEEKEVAARGSG